jgi:site-specific recombinase XerD
MQSMVALAPAGLTGLRDRALLLIGFAGAFRRSELVALDVAALVAASSSAYTTDGEELLLIDRPFLPMLEAAVEFWRSWPD